MDRPERVTRQSTAGRARLFASDQPKHRLRPFEPGPGSVPSDAGHRFGDFPAGLARFYPLAVFRFTWVKKAATVSAGTAITTTVGVGALWDGAAAEDQAS